MSLICPRCGRTVGDGALSCPYCHAPLDVTQRLSLSEATWCPDCGALVAPGAKECPKCGRVLVEEAPRRRVRTDMHLPDIGATGDLGDAGDRAGTGRTGVMTRIESAIPPADDQSSPSLLRDHMPRPRAFALAAVFALIVVGGAALLITHPWDPSASITRASEPADTSMSGFPGILESLSGQDSTREDAGGDAAPDAFDSIKSSYDQLAVLEKQVGESEDALRNACSSGDGSGLEKGLADARSISIDVSNLISDAGQLSDEGGVYAEDLAHIQTLGNWLRNRCDALTGAWELARDASDPSAVADDVGSMLDSARDYRSLFDENYDSWAPERSTAE